MAIYFESPVESIRKIRLRKLPPRKLQGTMIPYGTRYRALRGFLFKTMKTGTLYINSTDSDFQMRLTNPNSKDILRALVNLDVVSEVAYQEHSQAAQVATSLAHQSRKVSDFMENAERLGVKLTKAQVKKVQGIRMEGNKHNKARW